MPRYRTIACDHCGHLLLKSDIECEVCGSMTKRERNRWLAKAVQLGIMLIGFAFIYARLKGLGSQ